MVIIIGIMHQHVQQVALQLRHVLLQHHQEDLQLRIDNRVHRYLIANQVHRHQIVNQVHRYLTVNQVRHQVHTVVEVTVAEAAVVGVIAEEAVVAAAEVTAEVAVVAAVEAVVVEEEEEDRIYSFSIGLELVISLIQTNLPFLFAKKLK